MKVQTVMEKKMEPTAALPPRERNRWRKQAEIHGVPVFALRMLAARRQPLVESDTTLRFRHD